VKLAKPANATIVEESANDESFVDVDINEWLILKSKSKQQP